MKSIPRNFYKHVIRWDIPTKTSLLIIVKCSKKICHALQ